MSNRRKNVAKTITVAYYRRHYVTFNIDGLADEDAAALSAAETPYGAPVMSLDTMRLLRGLEATGRLETVEDVPEPFPAIFSPLSRPSLVSVDDPQD